MIIIPNSAVSSINLSIVIQMILIIYLFLGKKLTRKNNFYIRFIIFNSLSLIWAYNTTYYINCIFFGVFIYISIFVTQMLAVKMCYNEPWYTVLFVTAAAKTTEYIVSMLYSILSLSDITNLNFGYGGHWTIKATIYYPLISIIVYFFIYKIIVKSINISKELKFRNKPVMILIITSFFINVIINLYSVYFIPVTTPASIFLLIYFINTLSGCLILSIQFGMFNQSEKERQLEALTHIWNLARKQYSLSKENIDSINLKCHNIKHRILEFKNTNRFNDILNEIEIFDANINTHNDVLNVILSEKSLYCKNNGIQFSCIADGSLLEFMDSTDIYVLFGNIIDNAINAVSQLSVEKCRNIRLNIEKENSFVIILTENSYTGIIDLKNNMPVSKSEDLQNHGFGMLSIKNIVDKYEGCLTISTKHSVFCLNILIPII